MRKDSEIFLMKLLEYRKKVDKDRFEVNYKYFKEIPSIETAIYDIIKDLIACNCITSQSRVIDLEEDISINLTLDGITYFDEIESKEKTSDYAFNIYSKMVNVSAGNEIINNAKNNINTKKKTWKLFSIIILIFIALISIFVICIFKEKKDKNFDGELKLIFWDGKFAYHSFAGEKYYSEYDVVNPKEITYLEESITPNAYITIQDEDGDVVWEDTSKYMESCIIDLNYGEYKVTVSADNYKKYVVDVFLGRENKASGIWQHNIYLIPDSARVKDVKVKIIDGENKCLNNYEAQIGFPGVQLSEKLNENGCFESLFTLSEGEYIVIIPELNLHGKFVINDNIKDNETIQVTVN